MFRFECRSLTSCRVDRSNVEVLNSTRLLAEVTSGNALDGLAVINHVREVLGTPAHVVLVLDALGKESAQVGEGDEPVLLVEVVEECELALGVA